METRAPQPQSFLRLPICTRLNELVADAAILGIPYGTPYPQDGTTTDCVHAPSAIRAQSIWPGDTIEHYDFDFDGPQLDRSLHAVDCGDVPGSHKDGEKNRASAAAAIRAILKAGAVPLVLGGDDSVPIPFLRGFEGYGRYTIVQIDAHIDWRNEVNGVTEGYSSTMRRASEMPWIEGIVQIGMRGVGSARSQEVADARAYGADIIHARTVWEKGMDWVLSEIAAEKQYIVCIDCDALDPSAMPAASARTPGGLTYLQVTALLQGLGKRGRIAGFDLVELKPEMDVNNISAITACGLVINALNVISRQHRQPMKKEAGG